MGLSLNCNFRIGSVKNYYQCWTEIWKWPQTFYKSNQIFCEKGRKKWTASDACFQKALIRFSRGRSKKGSRIPVQVTVRSRRKIKHRGSGPSIPGRPTNKQSLRLQMQVYEDEDFVAHSIPSRSKTKWKQPHSLASAVASNHFSAKNIKMVYFTFIWQTIDIFIYTFFL